MIKKGLINLVIILLWVTFGIVYYQLFLVGRQAQNAGQEIGEAGSEPAETRRLSAVLAEDSRPLNPDALCLSTTLLSEPPWTNREFQRAVTSINVNTLRLPGGPVSGFWDWQTGRIASTGTDEEPRQGENSLESYLAGLQATGTTPILTLNMVTADLPDQLAFLEAMEAGGVPVTAVELGYKAYLGQPGPSGELIFPTVADYTAEAGRWAAEIRAQFPGVGIALSAAPPNFEGYQDWNSGVFTLAAEQGLAVSFYPFPDSPLREGQPFNEVTVTAVLGAPFQNWQAYTAGETAVFAGLSNQVPIWLTEYNIWSEPPDQPAVAGTWGESLFVMSQSLLYLSDQRVEFICPHPLMGRQRSAAYLIQDGEFQLQATGLALQMLGQVMSGMTSARQIEFHNVPVHDGVDYPVLMGWVFAKEDGGRTTAVMINLGNAEAEINIENLPAGFPNRFQQTVGNPNRRVHGRDGFEITNGTLQNLDQDTGRQRFIILSRYSVTTFSSVE